MGAKAWLAILGLGLGSVILMGLLTKFVVDSSPDLKEAIQFKTALAETFQDRGLKEVSLRRLPQQGYQLVLVATPPASDAEGERLDADIAKFFVENFPKKQVPALRLSYQSPEALSCGASEPYREQQVSLLPLRQEEMERKRREDLSAALASGPRCRLISIRRDGNALEVDVEAPEGAPASPGTEKGGRSPAAGAAVEETPPWILEARGRIRKLYSFETLLLRIHPRGGEASGKGAAPLEVRFDSRGKRVPPE